MELRGEEGWVSYSRREGETGRDKRKRKQAAAAQTHGENSEARKWVV